MQTSLPCPWDTLLLICAPRGWERTPWGGPANCLSHSELRRPWL